MIAPGNAWQAWSWDPTILVPFEIVALLYAGGLAILWRRGVGRGVAMWQASCFCLGLLALFVAFFSPIHRLSGTLFSFHMVQHMILMMVAAPLLVLGRAGLVLMVALPRRVQRFARSLERTAWARATGRVFLNPVVVLSLNVVVLWAWHLPVLYQAALRDQLVHAVEHASFLSVALPFWWLVLDRRGLRRTGYGPAVLLVFLNGIQSGALGALLTFAPSPLYPIHSAGVAAWNTTLVQDQQLAGLLMWIPAGTIFVVVASWLFLRWLGSMEGEDVKEVITSVG